MYVQKKKWKNKGFAKISYTRILTHIQMLLQINTRT